MEAVMGESGEANKEAADSSSTGESGGVHINGEMNGSCEAMDTDEAAIISTKSVGEIKNSADVNDIGDNCESDNDSISSKTNSCEKVPNEDSVKSSKVGTEVPNNIEGDGDQMEVDEQSIELIKDSDSENRLSGDESVLGLDLPNVANSIHDEDDENNSNCEDSEREKEPDADSSGDITTITSNQSNEKKVTENGDAKLSSNLDIDELSNDSAKREASASDNDKDKTEDKDGDGKGTESKSGETTPAKVKKSRKSLPPANITPRRSSRNLSRAQKSYSEPKDEEPEEEEPVEEDNDPDIEEITPVDPLADPLSMDVRVPINRPRINHNRKTTIVVSDTKKLVEIAAGARTMKGGKKEPTLVIIDTNSILSGRGPIPISQTNSHHNHSHSHGHSHTITTLPSTSSSAGYSVLPVTLPSQTMMYPKHRTTQQHIPIHLPIPKAHPPPPPQPPPPPPPQILPTLTDDMYVVEAPSFIVPYVYEKPPLKPLKQYIKKLSDEIERLTKLEVEQEKKQKEEKAKLVEDKKKADKAKLDKSDIEADVEKEQTASKQTDDKESNENNDKEKTTDRSSSNEVEESGPESSKCETKDNDEKIGDAVVSEESGKAEKSTENEKETDKEKESKVTPSNEVTNSKSPEKPTEVSIEEPIVLNDDKKEKVVSDEKNLDKDKDKTEENKPKTSSYFDNPLGKFFMQIGTSLVTESVQTQLLREQKRKRDRDTGKVSSSTQVVINHLLNNLELSKENNQHFHLPIKKCEFCSFRTESALVMAQHLETPHMRNYVYRCNFCPLEVRSPHDILFHMEAEHNVRGRLERAPAFHQCPNCPFEDNQKGKLTRHLLSCSKKFKPEKNLEPPPDWEPPAKIPRVSRNRPMAGGLGAAAYQAMVKQQLPQQQHPLLPKLPPSLTAMPGTMRGRGRPMGPSGQARYLPDMKLSAQSRNMSPVTTTMRPGMLYRPSGSGSQPQVLLPTSYQIAGNQIFQVVGSQGQMIPVTSQGSRLSASSHSSGGPTPVALVPNIAAGSSTITIQSTNKQQQATAKLMQQPSISITPLPRQPAMSSPHSNAVHNRQSPGQQAQGSSKTTFVICEICDGYIKDLDQLRNHMMWIHKVKIHPKMIYNRPPLNCQKCQFRFFTDQGLERHLLGSHGLVTSSMQEAANKGKDAGRCPICGRVYQWKLLNHVARDHSMTLKPAHLSYKCTVCTATFGMYKQFENHVYSAHSVVAKRVMEKKPAPQTSRPQPAESLLKSAAKPTDEITIIPQGGGGRPGPASRTGKGSAHDQTSPVHRCDSCEASFDGPNGFAHYLTHCRRRHLRRCAVKLCRLDSCPTCRGRLVTPRLAARLARGRVDVIELSDDEVLLAGGGRHEITITKVASAPGPRRFKRRRGGVQVIDLAAPPPRENGEDALSAVKERLRRRKSLEISQIDSEGDEGPSKRRRRNDE